MKKFYVQPARADCGPTAILNALRDHGQMISPKLRRYGRIKKIVKCNKHYGTLWEDLAKGLRRLGFKITYKKYCTIKYIENCLQKGFPVILNFRVCDDFRFRHYIYIPSQTNKYFNTTNLDDKAYSRKLKRFFDDKKPLGVFVIKDSKFKHSRV